MKITNLRPLVSSGGQDTAPADDTKFRGTEATDTAVEAKPDRTRIKLIGAAAGGLVLILVFGLLFRGWSATEHTISRERLRIVTVTEGPFVRDVSAQGTVVAAVSPTLFAVAPGSISYQVRAGDTVKTGQVLATLASPTLENEYQRERATLESLDTALQRQGIEIRRQKLSTQEAADLANVQIRAAEREFQRAQSAWDKGAIAERDLRRAEDERESARLAYEHARDTAGLERESLDLDLRARRLERERQGYVVANLKRRVDELSVRSPVNGMVANLAAVEKANVAENAALLTVVDLTAFEVEFQVADVYARDIKAGMEASISLDGQQHAGLVTAISPEVRSGQVTGRVKFAGKQPPGLRQSQRGSVRIVIEQRAKARKFERSPDITPATRAVYVVVDDRAVLTPVELGAASVAEIEVVNGLEPGDEVIVSGAGDMNDVPEFHIGG
ncbi:MAG: HlyD family efflux transporter periplasmic adaptor subunit [Steroidobacteraceae bacterium]